MGFALTKADQPPMMQRYLDYKERYPDALLFFQVGDFYELFFDDAVTVARSLNLTLTSRDKNSPNSVPMCGVPLAVIDSYIDRLLPLGFSVAVVSQNGSGQGVERTLERFVTPGMRLFNSVSSDSAESLIAAVTLDAGGQSGSIACTDPQTGVVRVREAVQVQDLGREVAQLGVREVVLPRLVDGEKLDRRSAWVRALESTISAPALKFRPEPTVVPEGEAHATAAVRSAVHGIGVGARRALRLLLSYLDEVSLGNAVPIREISLLSTAGAVVIDASTRRNLELVENSRDKSSAGSLFGFLNHTSTPAGARLLRQWVLAPLTHIESIRARHAAVRGLRGVCGDLARALEGISDLERLAARVQLKIATPKDLAAIRDSLERVPQVLALLAPRQEILLQEVSASIAVPEQVVALLHRALVDAPPHHTNEGGIIREGFDPELDQILQVRTNGEEWRAAFEQRERHATGISGLKVKSNNVIGYFIEVSGAHAAKVPEHYQRRQSTANAERFITPELKAYEEQVVTALDRQIRREQQLFQSLREQLLEFVDTLRVCAAGVALLDVLTSLATVADRSGWVEPQMVEEPILKIVQGRHPIVAALREGSFIPNSVEFGDANDAVSCFIVTGPNMGGKSTYLRQTALVTILAQLGSFVPAEYASVGIVDRIFARLGASDDLHEGDSTFMVEMREAAQILVHATRRSLVLIDELGRGTASSDGSALAQAIVERLVQEIGCRTLFATHYHELTALAAALPRVANLSVGSIEEGDRVVFTHAIQAGPAPRSYGLEVAKLSGLPTPVIERAKALLTTGVGSGGASGDEPRTEPARQLSLFGGTASQGSPEYGARRGSEGRGSGRPGRPEQSAAAALQGSAVRPDPSLAALAAAVAALDPDALTPRQAHQRLYELQALLKAHESCV